MHPSITPPHRSPASQGYRAYWNDAPDTSNPHPAGTVEHQQWLDGWRTANHEDVQESAIVDDDDD